MVQILIWPLGEKNKITKYTDGIKSNIIFQYCSLFSEIVALELQIQWFKKEPCTMYIEDMVVGKVSINQKNVAGVDTLHKRQRITHRTINYKQGVRKRAKVKNRSHQVGKEQNLGRRLRNRSSISITSGHLLKYYLLRSYPYVRESNSIIYCCA